MSWVSLEGNDHSDCSARRHFSLSLQAEKAKKEAEVAFEECSDAARQEVSGRGFSYLV